MRAHRVLAADRLPAHVTGPERAVWRLLPAAAFVIAALVTVALRDTPGNAAPPPVPVASDAAARMPAPRLADVPDLPAPLAAPRRRRPASTPPPAAPAPTPAPTPAAEDAPAVPAQPVPEPPPPEPPVAAPRPAPTPAPTFDDSGSGPEFDDSGPGP